MDTIQCYCGARMILTQNLSPFCDEEDWVSHAYCPQCGCDVYQFRTSPNDLPEWQARNDAWDALLWETFKANKEE